jgi:hypothetical protein
MVESTQEIKPKLTWFPSYSLSSTSKSVGGKLIQYIVAISIVIYLFFLMYFISKDKDALDKNYLLYMFALITPMVFMFLVLLSNSQSSNVIIMSVACIVILLSFLAFSYFPNVFYVNQIYDSFFDYVEIPGYSKESSFLISLGLKMIVILIAITALSIIYNLFLNSAKQNKTFGFIINFIFFIPCLLSDFVEFILNEYNTTSNVVFVLFILEIIFLIIYFYIPYKLMKFSLSKGKSIIREPTFLGETRILGGSELLVRNDDEVTRLEAKDKIINKNYALSLWISYNPLNVHKNDSIETPLFWYGKDSINTEKVGIPYLSYLHNDVFIIKYTNNIGDPINPYFISEIQLEPQRWNNIVFNYHNTKVDLFVNGILEKTIELGNGIPIYDMTNIFVVGSPNNKLHVALCNMLLFSEPLTISQVTNQYNLLKMQNPPVNNLL